MKKIIILMLLSLTSLIQVNAMHESSAPNEYLYHSKPEDIMSDADAKEWYLKNTGKKVNIIHANDRFGIDSGGEDIIVEE